MTTPEAKSDVRPIHVLFVNSREYIGRVKGDPNKPPFLLEEPTLLEREIVKGPKGMAMGISIGPLEPTITFPDKIPYRLAQMNEYTIYLQSILGQRATAAGLSLPDKKAIIGVGGQPTG